MKKRLTLIIETLWAAGGTYFKKIPTCRFHRIVFFALCAYWIYLLRGFFFGQLALIEDAPPYYGHIKFYIDNLLRGVYPLWDPIRTLGVPNDFFLRRMNEYNPFYLIILLLRVVGVPHTAAYMWFLAGYYLLGMTGFYLLAKRLFTDGAYALIAVALLMFSSLTTTLFENYIQLVYVPTIWFFYFVIAFFQSPRRSFLLGATFCVMLLATTYVPFFFITGVLTFLLCYGIVYFRDIPAVVAPAWRFVKKEKVFVALCAVALILALIPGYLFFRAGSQGSFVVPGRHQESKIANAVAIDIQSTVGMGTFTHLNPWNFFSSLNIFRIGMFYLPAFVYLVMALGCPLRLNRRLFFLFIWIMLVFLIASPDLAPLYLFCYRHIFFFKYFRMLHFFLSIILMPAFIIFIVEQLRLLCAYCETLRHDERRQKRLGALFVVAHILFLYFLRAQPNIIISLYLVTGASAVFFFLCARGVLDRTRPFFLLFVCAIIALQSGEVFGYLHRNAPLKPAAYEYDEPYMDFSLVNGVESPITREKKKDSVKNAGEKSETLPVYMSTRWNASLLSHIDLAVVHNYARHRFVLYDRAVWIKDADLDFERLEAALVAKENVAFISADGVAEPLMDHSGSVGTYQGIDGSNPAFEVVRYWMNGITVRTRFAAQKFLVYNDNYYPGWQAFIDGKETHVWRANISFKGVWVPAGDHEVTFRFGQWWRYALYVMLMGVFNAVLWATIILAIREQKRKDRDCDAVTTC